MSEWRYISILDLGTRWGKLSASRLGRFTTGEKDLSTNWIGGWLCPRVDLKAVK
jgi:hypothetical protein